jgi:hypothetical protein
MRTSSASFCWPGSRAKMMLSMAHVLGLLIALSLIAPPANAADHDRALVGDLIAAQTRLVESTREYRASLERVLAFQEADAERMAARVRSRRDLLERGVVSRREWEESERGWQAALSKLDETRKRMAEADALMGETLAAIELAKIPQAPTKALVATPAVIRYQGGADFAGLDMGGIERFFSSRFARPLPVSARGQTQTHDRLGLDHRHALDVAVHPDSDEGRELIEYLRQHHIPFLAFRQPIPGSSTGAHVHIGHASAPLAAVRATGR